MNGPALFAHGLVKRYRRKVALNGVNLSIPRGTVLALIGPNGAGKTTLIRLFLGFERADRGRVEVGGLDPWSNRTNAVRQVAYIPQRPAIYPRLTVEEHLGLTAALRPGFDFTFARERLRRLEIPPRQRADTLSGGQAAQLNLAMALGTRAPILLLDEPLASLDPLARREILQVLLDAVRADGLTVLLSTHNVTDIEAACDRVIVVDRGMVALDDGVDEARTKHAVSRPDRVPADADIVAAFPGEGLGESIVLWKAGPRQVHEAVEWGGEARLPSLEEVVLGHLAAHREPSSVPNR